MPRRARAELGIPGFEHVCRKDQAVQLQPVSLGDLWQPQGPKPSEQLRMRQLSCTAHVGDDVRQLVAGVAAVAADVLQLRPVPVGPGLELRPGHLGKDVVSHGAGLTAYSGGHDHKIDI